MADGWQSTSPAGDSTLGYVGPSEIWLRLDEAGIVQEVQLARSADTASYVQLVESDGAFLHSLLGANRVEASAWQPDAVSGATLTSRAIAAAVRAQFAEFSVESEESNLQIDADYLRSMPLPRAGYQGPTDAILIFDEAGRSKELRILKSFDNPDYLERIHADYGFEAHLIGLTVEEIAALTTGFEGIEGVSGATMTSQSLVESFRAAAQSRIDTPNPAPKPMPWTEWVGWLCGGAAAFLLIGPLRKRRAWRARLRLVVILGFGVSAGALLSLDGAFGWLRYGLPWKAAPLLAGFVIAAVLAPALLGRKIYCRSLCAHGAMQQLLAPGARTSLPPAWARRLRALPGTLLALALFAIALGQTDRLANWEPFAAWVPSAASTASLLLAAISLIVSSRIPLAYCHYGCPTGALLEYIRWQPSSNALRRGDAATLALLVIVLV